MQQLLQLFALGEIFFQLIHRIQPAFDFLNRLQRAIDPISQHSAAHAGLCVVEQMNERILLVSAESQRLRELQIAPRGRVQNHIAAAVEQAHAANVRQRVLLRFVEIAHQRAGGGDGIRRVLRAKAGK